MSRRGFVAWVAALLFGVKQVKSEMVWPAPPELRHKDYEVTPDPNNPRRWIWTAYTEEGLSLVFRHAMEGDTVWLQRQNKTNIVIESLV